VRFRIDYRMLDMNRPLARGAAASTTFFLCHAENPAFIPLPACGYCRAYGCRLVAKQDENNSPVLAP
jgi:hypothetical protein